MGVILKFNLISHVIFGLVGIIAFYAVLINLLKSRPNFRFLRASSLIGTLSFVFSWLTGGYYYVVYYGKAVKPVIKSGNYPWIHSVLMELKEHVFLFLPFIAVVAFLTIRFRENEILSGGELKKILILLVLTIVVFGSLIVVMGMAISGAANL